VTPPDNYILRVVFDDGTEKIADCPKKI